MPNGHKIYQHLPLQDPPKFTQIGIFGLKKKHLATQSVTRNAEENIPIDTFSKEIGW
jgi:hypothetical protein